MRYHKIETKERISNLIELLEDLKHMNASPTLIKDFENQLKKLQGGKE